MSGREHIRLVVATEALAFATHIRTADADSGLHGPHFHPYSKSHPFDLEDIAARNEAGWAKDLDQPGWRRGWVWVVDGRMVGHLTLHGADLRTALHRAMLGMGLVPELRGQGGGTRLLQHVLDWARRAPELDWIDLGVFSTNPRARRLYERLGFSVRGVCIDAFRIDGVQVDDRQMSVWVGAGDPPAPSG